MSAPQFTSSQHFLHTYIFPNLGTPGSKPNLVDFTVTIWIAALILVIRLAFERAVIPGFKQYLERAKGPGGGKAAFPVLDNLWIAAFAGGLTGFAWWVTVTANGGCTPWSTTACFAEWPHHAVALAQRWYMVLAFAYYLYELLGTVLGLGTKLKFDMVAHHVVTMALILIAYQVNLKRMSVMWQALFDLSNPILHSAKALHASGLKQLEGVKWALFNLFALTFLLCRVIGGPISILWPSFTIAKEVLPASYCHVCWGLEIFVYVLQLVWFYKIVEIATKGDKDVKSE
ncbi:Ceramide synthase 5 [Pleodorina starrii]|uniref:Ceramide synthase 5 n=1 Tax=Pleodorina starrii TaxID=330485 RepID=A0A9W6F7I7_9CHLO|nr:Ceramide synthase 5 [Pleodorina starrii]GLC59204.1 Ceramide synthase 5 [Pleodorina starrii]GLC74767.1 Ceramide synthase 5 [Pleodorina starrii]